MIMNDAVAFFSDKMQKNFLSPHFSFFALFSSSFFLYSQWLKILKHIAFEFWHFPPIFIILKVTCLVTLFDCFWPLKNVNLISLDMLNETFYYSILFCIILYYSVLFRIISYYSVLFCIILYYSALFRIIPKYSLLFRFIPYYLLFYIIL